ncbi:putative fungistatic metabolite [Colletotrichum orbiculare MAFF 240422]|uniref:Fungistatic metabolite n=1 Tax=Colletotrichum orbiculare (strain 104-T / ATCC 96160 / CBS 514.97 / LARS 414 / MAFF 240422) TaxID=1213857 RepID=N4V320_COLOR|nr:putative fungistatic metabolite [Colletotrichum orbiculare MAFF 240422]
MALTTWLLAALVGLANGLASTDTITWGGDNSRAGYQTNHNMDPSVVGSSQFGQLFKTLLPGRYGNTPERIFSQPLVYTPSGSDRQFVYVATQQNNVYKLDAKTGDIVASRNLHIPFLTADLDGCVDVNPHVGITATGVIDPATETLYLTSKTYVDQTQPNVAQGRPAGRYYIHALDVNDLAERPNYPVDLEGTVARNNPVRSFGGGIHHQRPGLLHVGQYIYAGFASHCVQYNFTGWIIGWDKTTGAVVERFATQGDGVPADIPGAGVWMSGGGLASDDAGSVFYATGNGYASQLATIPVSGRQPPTALEEAAVHMGVNDDGSLTVRDFFMPHEKQALDGADWDLGTSPLQILPGAFSCGSVRRIGVVTGKNKKTYFIDLDNMGGYRNAGVNSDEDAVIQTYLHQNSVYAGAGVYPLEGGYIYINVIQYPSVVFKFSCDGGVPSFTKVGESPAANAYILGVSHGTVTSLNGQPGTGLLWTLDVAAPQLKIFEAVPKDGKLVLVKSFNVPGSTKFGRAVFGDGIMYQGTTEGYVYGFGSPVATPINCTSPAFGTVSIGGAGEPEKVTCTAVVDVTVTDAGLDDVADFSLTLGSSSTLPLTLAAGQSFDIDVVFKPTTVGLISADLVVNTTNSVAGYAEGTHVRISGTGESDGPLLDISPVAIGFSPLVTGTQGGAEETIILSNQGNAALSITSIEYAETIDGPYTTWDRSSAALTVGHFTITNLPGTIAANSGVTARVAFDPSASGSFNAFVRATSDGGTRSFSIAATAGPAPVALVEFQTPDGLGWVEYDAGKNFSFGNVTENTSRALKFRVTNAAPPGSVDLDLTVSKPPFGLAGIVSAANQVDLAEGTTLAPGESADAVMLCSVPKAQWNTDPYTQTAPWTMNTNDPTFEKHFFSFECTAVAEQAAPLLPDGQGRYRYVGCFKENNPGRQLSNQLYGNAASTSAMCIEACAAGSHVFCGTQYHTECWGGSTMPVERVDERNCNFQCGGDLNQICGGNGFGELEGGAFLSLFADSVQWDGNTTTPTPAPPGGGGGGPNPGGPEVNPGVGRYVSEGCYTEATDARALPNLVDLEHKTVANCIGACSGRANTYAGLEYGGECWCGNVLAEGSVPAEASECSMPCSGNSSEYCGGPSRLNLYKLDGDLPAPTTTSSAAATTTGTTTSSVPSATAPANDRVGDWLFQGCFTEGSGVRALPARTYANDSMTLESCGGFCEGLRYFGTEYGRECWCGDELDVTSVEAPLTDCSFPCAGDGTQKCGAGDRLQVYLFSPKGSATQDSVPASTTASSSVEATTATAFPTTSAVANGTLTAVTASETATEEVASSSLSTLSISNSSVTSTAPSFTAEAETTSPISSASSASLETLEATTTAVPSSSIPEPSSTPLTPTLLPQNTTSPASSPSITTSTTSSSSSSSTTSSSSSSSPIPTGPVISHGNENFTYYGCFSEPELGRLLPTQVLNDGANMTVARCLGACHDRTYAGVEYGRECWCGDALDLGGAGGSRAAANETGGECSFTCPGNGTEFCGAGSRISLYILTEELERLDRLNATTLKW